MPLEIPQLDDRTFEQLFAEATARIQVHTPEWTNFNDSDPGMTIVQVFAFMTENLLYRANRIPEANRKKFLTLLGVPLQPATPGRGMVAFRNERGPVQSYPLDAGVELRAGKAPFRTRTSVCILPITAAPFYKKRQTGLDAAATLQYQRLYASFLETDSQQLEFYKSTPLDPPEIGRPLPVVDLKDDTIDRALWVALLAPPGVALDAARAALDRQTLTLGLYPPPGCEGLTLEPQSWESRPVTNPGLVFEIAAPDPSVTDTLAPPVYKRLQIEYAENVLETPGIVQVVLPESSKLTLWDFDPEEEGTLDYPPLVEDKGVAARIVTWLRIRLPDAAKGEANADTGSRTRPSTRLTWVGVNAARVLQAVRVTDERLGTGTGAPDQLLKVANTPVIVNLTTGTQPGTDPTSTFILQVQDGSRGWDTWQRIDDLFAAGPNDRVYTLDPESGQVSFGSGLRGMRPPLGMAIRATYEYGGGPAGHVPPGAITKSAALPGGFKVDNPVATWGAGAGEDTAAGERNIPRYLKHRDRLVTASDFRDITLRTPGVDIGRVEVLPLFSPLNFDPNDTATTAPGAVTVMVVPKQDAALPDPPVPDRLFLEAVCEWLDPRRLVTTEIFVRGPVYVPLWVSVGVTVMPGHVSGIVQREVRAAIREYLSPLLGGPPVAGAPSLDAVCTDPPTASDPCPKPRGLGWPLNMEVRRQDLEAVATRVAGVRYVDTIKLGVMTAGGVTLTGVDRVTISGLQLPWPAGVHVREGSAEDLESLLGAQPADPTPKPMPVPVPLLPKRC